MASWLHSVQLIKFLRLTSLPNTLSIQWKYGCQINARKNPCRGQQTGKLSAWDIRAMHISCPVAGVLGFFPLQAKEFLERWCGEGQDCESGISQIPWEVLHSLLSGLWHLHIPEPIWPHLIHLYVWNKTRTYFNKLFWRFYEIMHAKCLQECLAPGKGSLHTFSEVVCLFLSLALLCLLRSCSLKTQTQIKARNQPGNWHVLYTRNNKLFFTVFYGLPFFHEHSWVLGEDSISLL